jgi:hypothetical protein
MSEEILLPTVSGNLLDKVALVMNNRLSRFEFANKHLSSFSVRQCPPFSKTP